MRLDAIKVHALGSFRDFEVDLTTFGDAKLVAVVGPNGAGKSTLLELALPGALFRQCPTRGSLQELATARDSFVEARVTNGATYTIRHSLDAVSRKGETTVLDERGAPVLPGTSVKAFDAWAARHLPAPEVLFASVFAPQGAEGFLGAKPGDRKAILLRTLGIERYEVLAEKAREHGRMAKGQLETLRARIEDERQRGGDVEAIEREIETLESAATNAARVYLEARDFVELARSGEGALALARREAQAARDKRAELGARISARTTEAAQVEAKIRNNEAALADAPRILAAKARTDEIAALIAQLDEKCKAAEASRLAAVRERDQHRAAEQGAILRAEGARKRAARARERLADRERIEKAEASLPALEAELVRLQGIVAEAAAALEQTRSARLAGADERIAELREGLAQIAGMGDEQPLDAARGTAERALVEDDAAVRLAAELPVWLEAAEGAHRLALEAEAGAARALADARTLAARAGEIEAAAAEAEQTTRDAEAADDEARRAALAASAASEDAVAHEDARVAALEARNVAQAEQTDLAPLARLAGPLAQAEGRLAELRPQLAATQKELAELRASLDTIPEPAPVATPPDIAALEARATAADEAAKGAASALTLAQGRLGLARESRARIETLETDRRALDAELSDWTRLGADLGRDGLQALEIDAAGPELTELVNDLLRTCIGPRWTVSIETTKPSADGKRLLEGCEVRVLDTEKGRDAEASTFSGGERVILGEAVSLALTMLGCRRSGLQGVTLVRDESGAALDPENGRRYVAMLRRAAELVGASRVLFVTHSPELAEMADARIEVTP
jgi:exonuclease SbcC